MPRLYQNLEWLDHNSQRNYPLADTASARDLTDTFRLPEDFLLELDLPVHAGLDIDPAKFYLRFLGAYGTGYSLIVAYNGETPRNVATALVARGAHQRNQAYALGGLGDFSDTVGKVLIGRLDAIDQQPPGFWEFGFEAGRLDPDAIRPIIRGVSSLVVVNGLQRSAPLYGDVELVAGTNMQLVPSQVSGQDPQIVFNAISGAGLVEDCACDGDAANATPITRINGIPGINGHYTLANDVCVEITPITNGLKIGNPCAQPCCDCTDLEKITRALSQLASQAATVEDFNRRLRPAVETMDQVVLGSRLGDNRCVVCE